MRLRTIAFAAALAATPAAARAGCDAAQAYSESRKGVALMILRHGQVVCERYAPGWTPDRAIELQSITKSLTALMLAAAVQDGFLHPEDRVSNTLVEWRDDPRKDQIVIRELLDFTSGIRVGFGAGVVPTYAQATAAPMENDPGVMFEYGAGSYQVFGEVMARQLRMSGENPSPVVYFQRRVLDPLGIRPARWTHLADKNPTLPSGAHLTARDLAVVGEFVRAGGRWNGRQLVDPATLAQSVTGSAHNPAYGIGWWTIGSGGLASSMALTRGAIPVPRDWIMAAGAGKQRLLISREAGLTVVRLAPRDGGAGWSDREFLSAILSADLARPAAPAWPQPAERVQADGGAQRAAITLRGRDGADRFSTRGAGS